VKQKSYDILKKKKIRVDSTSATITKTPATMPADFVNFPKLTPRICSVFLSENDTAFGFDVASGMNHIGLYIQKVFPNSPASIAGLRNNDRIIEINGRNVDKRSSRSIKKKLNKIQKKNSLILLVVDTQTYEHYTTKNMTMSSADVKRINGSAAQPFVPINNNGRSKYHRFSLYSLTKIYHE
jgi:predicted metalloprotease with PDZ domain